jgi:Tol biopolymer transport system component
LVTASNFSDGGTRFFMDPVLSPNGETLAFSRMNEAGELRAWVMQTGTGVPERLHESGTETEYVADWSPDGTRVLELIVDNGRESLSVVKLGERGNPTVIREGVLNLLPAWSPAGEWITYFDKNGWNLTSPDGKTRQNLGHINTPYLMFSRDGKRLYGIRNKDTENKLFALDLAARSVTDMRDVGKEFAPASDYNPGIRFTLTPDGKTITYASGTYKADLWLLEGFQQPGWFARLFR